MKNLLRKRSGEKKERDEASGGISGKKDWEHESRASCTVGLRSSIPAGRRANIDRLRMCGDVALHYILISLHCTLLLRTSATRQTCPLEMKGASLASAAFQFDHRSINLPSLTN